MSTPKLVIFDLDGTLIDSRELHYHSLNRALEKISPNYVISKEEHLSTYDGLNTTKKLELLHTNKGLPKSQFDTVWREKQQMTFDLIRALPKDAKLIDICQRLKSMNYLIAVATNSIRETTRLALHAVGILEYVDVYYTNQDVMRSKPYPEMYWQCMMRVGAIPSTTIIVEDSHIGREGALNSGAHLLAVEDNQDLTWTKLSMMIEQVEAKQRDVSVPWKDSKLNVLIPMAGAGSRFAQQGYTFPKPLIEVNGKPMIEVVVRNLNIEANYIFIVQKEHYEKYNLKYLLNLIAPDCRIVMVDGITEGAACTTLLAKEYINNENPLVIANSDQYVEWNSNECMYAFSADSIDGGILTFKAHHPKWSYARVGEDGFVCEVAEKRVISDDATVGIYYWKRGSDYVQFAEQMIANNTRVNNEFYVCPVFNEAIGAGRKIRIKGIEGMWGIGTPEDLNYFLSNYRQK